MMIKWFYPHELWAPHKVTNPEKAEQIANELCLARGWGLGKPALVGYYTFDRGKPGLQLLTGSHRLEAARIARVRVPVVIVPEETVEKAWGDLVSWRLIMNMGDVAGRIEL